MSLHSKPLNIGILIGAIYDFDVPGDKLPLHIHNDKTVHISIVARGSFEITGPTFESVKADTGVVMDWDKDTAHEFTALEPNSRLINIIKV